MNAKEYLQQIRKLDREINAKIEQLDNLRMMATRTSPKPPSGMSSGGNGWSNDRMADCVANIVDLDREINRGIDRLVNLKREVMRKIDAIQNADYRLLLTLRYINGLTWEQVAVEMGYTYRHIIRLHGNALQKI